jgi:hypothetical protein
MGYNADKKSPATFAAELSLGYTYKPRYCGVNAQADYLLLPPFLTVVLLLLLAVPLPR